LLGQLASHFLKPTTKVQKNIEKQGVTLAI